MCLKSSVVIRLTERQGHDKLVKVLVNAPNILYFIILISLSHTDLVVPVVVITNALKEGKTIHVCTYMLT